MTRIDFYFNADSKLQVACQLAAKALQQRLQVFIYAPEESVARGIDRMLWTFQAISFIPHCLASDALAPETPVLIARAAEAATHDEVILNLHGETPPSFSRFRRLVEVVGAEQDDRQAARGRFRFYRDRGYDIVHHDLAGGAA
jgi:DNA polymerase-3 subunit chi